MAAGLLPVEAPKAQEPVANGFQSAGLHACVRVLSIFRASESEAGLLTAPRAGAGSQAENLKAFKALHEMRLALTLSADPSLDGTHRVLGL